MHVATTLVAVIAVIITGVWRNWREYHTTLLFVALGNLSYNFLTANYFLWRLDADFITNHTLTEMLYTFIVFPATVLLFLHNFPDDMTGKLQKYTKWILLYGVWEWVFKETGYIEYQYGWSLWWSVAFLFVMFPLIKLHLTRPILTYFLSGIVAVVVLLWFDVPVYLPVEER
ncbi:CBO0543 family protein [Ornithinibacillus californiensis]|uniref:CBO0543 family protein n=1 Tax=Ornithinibacillus californiensis TaxID=161536 RepID=UPI00064DF7ED|nr:CBO0543 family protein [Ornithinibacillus californiensis]